MMHPVARQLCSAAGITEGHGNLILAEVQARNPYLLLGGFHADYAVLGAWLALHEEDGLSEDDVNQRVDNVIAEMFNGLI